jgi:DNA-damage-inducible protein D
MPDRVTSKLAIFEGKHIRKTFLDGMWWFAVIDVVEVLTGSSIPKRYWSDLEKSLFMKGLQKRTKKSYS